MYHASINNILYHNCQLICALSLADRCMYMIVHTPGYIGLSKLLGTGRILKKHADTRCPGQVCGSPRQFPCHGQ